MFGAVVGYGNSGNNRITGNNGNNILVGLGGADTLDGGAGSDTATYAASTSGVNVSLATGQAHGGDAEGDVLISIENLIGSASNDTLEGDVGNNMLTGGGGVDTLSYEHATTGVTVNLSLTAAQNTGGAGTDTISGFSNAIGSSLADILTGNQMANTLIGGAGNDTLNGAAGNDLLEGDGGRNTFVFGANFGKDTIKDFKLGQDIVQLDRAIFPQASKLAAAISDDGFGNAMFAVNTNNTITFLGVSANDLKQHTTDFQIV